MPQIGPVTQLAKRVMACLDVRANDHGDLVVTKGDQYDVRDKVCRVLTAAVRKVAFLMAKNRQVLHAPGP